MFWIRTSCSVLSAARSPACQPRNWTSAAATPKIRQTETATTCQRLSSWGTFSVFGPCFATGPGTGAARSRHGRGGGRLLGRGCAGRLRHGVSSGATSC